MNKKLDFLWIDDEPKRIRAARSFEMAKNVKVTFEDVRTKDLFMELKRILNETEPDLILIDHKLDKVSGGIVRTGSSAAEIIREKWLECPIVCITAVELKDISLHRQYIYEDILKYSSFSNYYSTLLSIAKSYKKLKSTRAKNINSLLKLIDAPKGEIIRLSHIMPEEIKAHFNDASLLFNISRWIRHNLMVRPGFLYDRLWTATLLGIKETSFKKVEKDFKGAKYKGIFADQSNERWWQAKLREILYSMLKGSELKLPWELGRELPGITKGDYSVCYACKKDLPETVGYLDERSETKKQMHLRCTVTNPNLENLLFFEEIRMMKAAE